VCGPLNRTWVRGGHSEHTLATLGAEAAAHPLVLAEAVGMAPDVAWAQRAELAEVRASPALQSVTPSGESVFDGRVSGRVREHATANASAESIPSQLSGPGGVWAVWVCFMLQGHGVGYT